MNRINLLPPEILEKRKTEKRLAYVLVAYVAVGVVFVGIWGLAAMRVSSKQAELDEQQQLLASTTKQAKDLEIFELQEGELERRRAVAALALDKRRNWGKLLDEISLVLPSDMWLNVLKAGEKDGLQLDGYAVDADDTPDYGHKTIAKLLVRLADLEQLVDVWLTNSVSTEVEDQPALQFTVTAGVREPASTVSTATAGQ